MHALLVVSHGSRRHQSNEEVSLLCDCLKQQMSGQFDLVHPAFLEIAAPSIPQGIQQCVDLGATAITVLPYFLAAGRHVSEDIPCIVDSARKDFPDIDFTVTPHVGAFTAMPQLISDGAKSFGKA